MVLIILTTVFAVDLP